MRIATHLTLAFALAAVLAAPARATDLRDLEGRARSLDGYVADGKWTVVMLWASDCPVCAQEAPAWALFDSRHRAGEVRVVGVSLDGAARLAEARAFVERHLLDFPNLIGEPEVVARLYAERARQPWLGTPSFLLYDPAGQLRARQVGALPPERVEAYIERQRQPAP
jgi:thiol-disulfide isomerase/thioredoxin